MTEPRGGSVPEMTQALCWFSEDWQAESENTDCTCVVFVIRHIQQRFFRGVIYIYGFRNTSDYYLVKRLKITTSS